MKVRDIMTTKVHFVSPSAPVDKIAALMLLNFISAVPVIDATGGLVGIVSEGDLFRRAEVGTEPRRSWWLELISDSQSSAETFIKTHGRTAADVMTRHVISVDEDTEAAEVAEILSRRGIKRVPVLRNGALVGIVSRADLIQFLVTSRNQVTKSERPDADIRTEIMASLRNEPWGRAALVSVMVSGGNVELNGLAETKEQAQAIKTAVEAIPGVRTIKNSLRIGRLPVDI